MLAVMAWTSRDQQKPPSARKLMKRSCSNLLARFFP
uniref:Uncharacterized protein n=1 Tax=Rhizophora mucronata TaxID=61149 RepID=A0A2P2MY58_RHIMU